MLDRVLVAFVFVAGLAVSDSSSAGASPAAVEIKPPAIIVSPRADEVQRSCVVYRHQGGMQVFGVSATDPQIGVDFREHRAGQSVVVTATIPAGYRTPSGDKVYVVVETNLEPPEVRIPVETPWVPQRVDTGWLVKPKSLIGRPFPRFTLNRVDGAGKLEINPRPGEVSVVVFSLDWCAHCDDHMPVIARVVSEYASRGVRVFGIAAGGGDEEPLKQAAERWGVSWPVGVDRDWRAAQKVGVRAYPVVFLIGQEGVVESVHGRYSNRIVDNGLDYVDIELSTELDLLLAGGTREGFPNWAEAWRLPGELAESRSMPRIVMDAVEHDLGEVQAGDRVEHRFKITNTGSAELRIVSVRPNDRNVALAGPYPRALVPGGAGEIPLAVNVSGIHGTFAQTAIISTNDPEQPQVYLTLKGRAKPPSTTTRPSAAGSGSPAIQPCSSSTGTARWNP